MKCQIFKRATLGLIPAVRWTTVERTDCPAACEKDMIALLPEHHLLPVWKHSGSKRERFAAVSCEIQRKDDPGQGAASHGKGEG